MVGEVMIEVKLSDEESKSGASEEHAEAIAQTVRSSSRLQLRGLVVERFWETFEHLRCRNCHR